MAWDEWERLKSDAAQKTSTNMQLNQSAASGGGGGVDGDLVVNQDDLGAVGHEAFVLHGDLQKAADIAGAGANKEGAGSTMQAAAALKSHGFATGGVLETTVEMWTSQVRSILQACAHISNHLDFSKKLHAQDDAKIAAALRGRDGSAVSASELDKYFK
ncbi:hypothetical protein [Streptomyces neyagawaensis]|uniref:hypothetical protein n=1 Tax=Streptomyces neyagawaensis TaxID=42238 RepID=UPI0006E28B6F|nr:hypothetical protein [Streptomyces neyagawaensis]MCL6733003.1 hypothetical protein [Streptomyces neyagawaensis]MDE1684864.1 hypothetical protein [Streptomyces neyagawaensis]